MNPLIITAASFAFSVKCRDIHKMIDFIGHTSDVLSEEIDERIFHHHGISQGENCDFIQWGEACRRGPYCTMLFSLITLAVGFFTGPRFNAGAFNLYPLTKEVSLIIQSLQENDPKDNDYSHVRLYLGIPSYLFLISLIFIATLYNLYQTFKFIGVI